MKVVSSCPLRVESVVWQAASGTSVVTVAAKATFLLQPTESPLAAEQDEPNADDGYWNDDERRSLHVAGDLVPLKARADVTLVGHAFAPRGHTARSLMTRMVVGDVDKSIEVFADRAFALDGSLHEGPGFTAMPLTWERAAGGPHTSNPVGVRADAAPDTRGWTPLPNLQPPGIHVVSRGDFIPPVGFAPVSPWWSGRQTKLHRGLAGWDFRAWRGSPLPADLDSAFFNAAPPDQQTDAIRANERIVLENLLRDHPRLVTSLVPITPRVRIERAVGPAQELEMRCDTLSIDTDRGTCALTWRRQLLLEQEEVVKRVVVVAGPTASSAAPVVEIRAPEASGPSSVTGTLLPGKLLASELPFVKGAAPPRVDVRSSVTGTLVPGTFFTSELPFHGGAASGPTPRAPAEPFVKGAVLPFGSPRHPLAAIHVDAPAPVLQPAAPGPVWGADDEQTQPVMTAAVQAAPATPWLAVLDLESLEMRAAPPSPARPALVQMLELPLPFESVRSSPAQTFDPRAEVEPPAPVPLAPTAATEDPPAPPAPEGDEGDTADRLPAAIEAAAPPAAPAPREVSIERYGAITAAIAMARPETDKILEDEELTKDTWQAATRRWDEALREEQERGKTALRKAFDEAYVGRVEERRGPITPEEYARLVVASERGSLPNVTRDLSLPRGAPMRIERVWLAKLMQDALLDKRARAAISAERER